MNNVRRIETTRRTVTAFPTGTVDLPLTKLSPALAMRNPRICGGFIRAVITATTDAAGDARFDVQAQSLGTVKFRDVRGTLVNELSGLELFHICSPDNPQLHLGTGPTQTGGRNLGNNFNSSFEIHIPLPVGRMVRSWPVQFCPSVRDVIEGALEVSMPSATVGSVAANQLVMSQATLSAVIEYWDAADDMIFARLVSGGDNMSSNDDQYPLPGLLRYASMYRGAGAQTVAVPVTWDGVGAQTLTSDSIGLDQQTDQTQRQAYEYIVQPRRTAPTLATQDEIDGVVAGFVMPIQPPVIRITEMAPLCSLHVKTSLSFSSFSSATIVPRVLKQYVEVEDGATWRGAGGAGNGNGNLSAAAAAAAPTPRERAVMAARGGERRRCG